jgi:hypothetical protein
MTPQDIAAMAQHASQQNDRYLFLLVVFFVFAGGAAFGVWLLKYLKQLVADIREDGKAFAGVVQENTKAFSAQRETLSDLIQEIRRR